MSASSSTNLKTLGLGFPYCFKGVIVPTSTNPKPNLNNELYTSAFLSNPAAIPIGLSKFLLNNSVLNNGLSLSSSKIFGTKLNIESYIGIGVTILGVLGVSI